MTAKGNIIFNNEKLPKRMHKKGRLIDDIINNEINGNINIIPDKNLFGENRVKIN